MGLWLFLIITALVIAIIIYYYFKVYQRARSRELELPYTQGLNHLLEGDLEAAKEKFHKAVQQDSDNLDAYLKMGAILREQDQVIPAIKVHQSLTVRPDLKQGQRVEIYKELALDYEQAEAYERAAESAEKIFSVVKDHRWALSFRIRIAEKLKDWQTAFDLTRRMNALDKKKDDQRLALYRVEEGLSLIESDKGKDGRIKCREALKLDRTCAHAYLTLAHSYIDEKREEDAAQELQNLLDANPEKSYLAYEDLESLFFNLGRFGDLEKVYRDIISKQPDNLEASKSLARFLNKKGEVDSALRVCTEAMEKHPDDLWMRRFMIRALVEADRLDQIGPLVIEILDRVLVEEPFYVCSSCGYRTKEPRWRCPECSTMDSFNI